MSSLIDDYVKRPMRYQNIDDLGELCVGVLLTACIPFDLIKNASPSSFYHYWPVVLICAAALIAALLYGLRTLKARITYPRTGFVKYRQAGTRVFVASLLSVAGAVAVAVALATVFVLHRLAPHSSEIVWAAVGSAIWGLFYVCLTRIDAPWRWVVLVTLIVAPPIVATFPVGRLWLGSLPDVLIGLIYFVSGAITLTLYIRRNPVPEQVAE